MDLEDLRGMSGGCKRLEREGGKVEGYKVGVGDYGGMRGGFKRMGREKVEGR